MSTDYSVVGIKPPDEKWKKMKAVWDACTAAKISVPDDVERFFNYETPDKDGVKINLTLHPAVEDIKGAGMWGYAVHICDLPADIKIVKFEAHY